MCFFQSSQEFNYRLHLNLVPKLRKNYKNIGRRGRPAANCTLMADSIRVAQPIRLQRLH